MSSDWQLDRLRWINISFFFYASFLVTTLSFLLFLQKKKVFLKGIRAVLPKNVHKGWLDSETMRRQMVQWKASVWELDKAWVQTQFFTSFVTWASNSRSSRFSLPICEIRIPSLLGLKGVSSKRHLTIHREKMEKC